MNIDLILQISDKKCPYNVLKGRGGRGSACGAQTSLGRSE